MGNLLSIKFLDILFKVFVITALIIAFYNAYEGWFKDNFSSLLFYITLAFVMLGSLIKEIQIKKEKTSTCNDARSKKTKY